MEIIIGVVAFIVGLIVIIALCQTAAYTGRAADYQRKSYRMLKAMAFKQSVIDGKGNFIGFYVDDEGNVSLEPFSKKKDGWPDDEKKESSDKLKNALL